jgi:hypothetical protein
LTNKAALISNKAALMAQNGRFSPSTYTTYTAIYTPETPVNTGISDEVYIVYIEKQLFFLRKNIKAIEIK